jgi:ribonuclease HI
MAGIKKLDKLLKLLKPELSSKDFVISTISEKQLHGLGFCPQLAFIETKGVTVIIEERVAKEKSLSYSNIWRMITLNVYSDLEAVGFIARITDELAKAGISVNVVSAYYHDHLFVPKDKAHQAIEVLKKLSES